jgi:glycosidase
MQDGRKLILLAEGTNAQNLHAGFDLDYGWQFCDVLEELYNGSKSIDDLFNAHNNEFSQIPAGKQKLRFTTNHDRASENSPVTKYKTLRGSMSAFVISTALGGVPLIYSSQETGYPNAINFFKYVNVDWSSNQDIYKEYKNIMAIYTSSVALQKGALNVFVHSDVVCFTRKYENQELLILANVRNTHISYTLPGELADSNWKDLYDNTAFTVSSSVQLAPYQYYILEKQ